MLKEKIKEAALPFLLCMLLDTAIFAVYGKSFISVYTPAFAIITAAVFAICEFVNKHKIIGAVIIIVMINGCLDMLLYYVYVRSDYRLFSEWFLTGASEVNSEQPYFMALLVSFPFFFAVTVYYFTRFLYRSSFIMMLSLVPCTLYVKVISQMDMLYIVLIAAVNIAIMIYYRQKNEKNLLTFTSVFSSAVMVSAVLLIASVIPKENEARYYDRFERIFMNADMNTRFSENFSNFSQFSGNANRYSNFRNSLMYTVYAPEQLYVRRQTFDIYYYDENRWAYNEKYSYANDSTADSYCENMSKLSLTDMQKAIRAACSYDGSFAEKYGFSRLADFSDINENERTASIYAENFPAVYFLTPVRVTGFEVVGQKYPVYSTKNGVLTTQNAEYMHPANAIYSFSYYDEISTRFFWFELGGADLSDEKCREMYADLTDILAANHESELLETVYAFRDNYSYAMEYKEFVSQYNERIPEKISALAHELTDGYEYDWQKANAIQDYLAVGDYTYNLRYTPPKGFDTPEYFIFESKTGTCSDFATAFCLMARSVGLTVRYTEGFAPDMTSEAERYVIRDNCSHAYPEVYIQNMGWIVFEPTVASPFSGAPVQTDNDAKVDYSIMFRVCAAAFAVLSLMAVGMVFAPVIKEEVFTSGIKKADTDNAIKLAYSGMVSFFNNKTGSNAEYLTPFELFTAIAEYTGKDISGVFCEAVERVCYMEKHADENYKTSVISEYIRLKKDITAASKIHKNDRLKKYNERKSV